MAPSLLLLAVFCLAVVGCASAQGWTAGTATFTGENAIATSVPNGACGFGTLTTAEHPGLALAGISQSKSALASGSVKGCGQCLSVRCTDKEACLDPSKEVTVMVYDNCDKCGDKQINLSGNIFTKLASLNVGKVDVEYKAVPCSFSGGVTVRVDEVRASDGGWVRLVFKTVNGAPLEKVELTKAGRDGFRPMKLAFGAAWEASRLPSTPWDIRLTNAAGKSIVLPAAVTEGNTGDYKTSKNF